MFKNRIDKYLVGGGLYTENVESWALDKPNASLATARC